MEISKEEFEAYVKVQNSGQFNMFTEGYLAAHAAGLPIEKYKEILFHYCDFKKKYA